jgi:cytochrome b561
MSAQNTTQQWGWVAKTFHWLMFLLIVGAWFAVTMHEGYPKGSEQRAAFMMLHKSLGVSVFFLIWLRLGWRLSGRTPDPDPAPQWQLKAATLLHWALYALMILMPLSGLLMSQFGGKPVAWFGVFEIPVFVTENKELAGQIKNMHENVWWPILLTLSIGHILAALWHHVGMKDNTLRRMLPFSRSDRA